jgi:cytochrome d ubiquinol oxidase subunit II
MSTELLIDVSAAAALFGVMAYGIFGGADFGGGVWDLFATGPRQKEQRLAIQKAMGPVWEANHVWLIFVVVVLFTCFPIAYAHLAVALFLPFHLAIVGIMLRGASFVFRSYQSRQAEASAETSVWGVVFGVASIISPVLLGAAFGVVTEGLIHVKDDQVTIAHQWFWLSPYAIMNGLLALVTCAYLAAVYLTNETKGELREDFRLRAIIAGTATAVLAGLVLLLAWFEARWFVGRLLSARSLPVVLAGMVCFAGSAWAVFQRRFVLARIFAAGEICLLILGWGLAQHPYLCYPDLTFAESAAPRATLAFLVFSLPCGAALLGPSLFYLFRVFKSK